MILKFKFICVPWLFWWTKPLILLRTKTLLLVDMPLVQTADHFPFARSYQLDALEMAMKHNAIVVLETGFWKALVDIMLIRSYTHLLQELWSSLAVFLAPLWFWYLNKLRLSRCMRD